MESSVIDRFASAATGVLASLREQQPDSLLKLIGAHRTDPRAHKIDVGVGVYRDAAGQTPVFAAVKEAERRLSDTQESKSYLGAAGDTVFVDLVHALVYGDAVSRNVTAGVQTPGGTGALRLAFDLLMAASPGARVHVALPTWPVHHSILKTVGATVVTHRHCDLYTQTLCFDEMLAAFERAEAGDAVLLHGACHNPTGIDFSLDQWRALAVVCRQRHLLPIIDFAYQGLGDGVDADAAGLRLLVATVDDAIVTYSCDKNFGLYRDRVGALFVKAGDAASAEIYQANLLTLARSLWSMPPDHGAAVVRLVLQDDDLRRSWSAELDDMRIRLADVRACLAAIDPRLASIAAQRGIFSTLPLGDAAVAALAVDSAVYMAAPGRINIAGLVPAQIEPFARAVLAHIPAGASHE
ncbi:aromatic amino acid transaminase [Sphingomonas sp.]|uniref:aromatic amino acid transaminase n=1 Tax=Sphingomonas sp. TaxID=28214 RepID=UPI003D6D3A90